MNLLKNLKINDTIWDELLKESQAASIHPIAMAIDKGQVREAEYIDSTKMTCSLSWLNQEFFEKAPDLENLKTFQFQRMRAAGILPLGSWDGKNYFAKICPEPLDHNSYSLEGSLLDPVFVLAPWSGMKKWFDAWSELANHKETPDGIKEATGDILMNITFDSSSLLGTDTKSQSIAAPPTPAAQKPSAPPSPKKITPITPPPKVPPIAPPIQRAAPPIPAPIPKGRSESERSFSTSVTRTTKELFKKIEAIPFEVISSSIKMCKSYEDLCALMMGAWKNFFEDIMILNLKDDKMSCYKWIGQWQISSQDPHLFSITEPSIFKIAKDTAQPYHGYIVTNKPNQDFFDQTYKGKIPEHATVMPISASFGPECLLVGVCTKSMSQKININSLEVVAHQFGDQLKIILSGAPLHQAAG